MPSPHISILGKRITNEVPNNKVLVQWEVRPHKREAPRNRKADARLLGRYGRHLFRDSLALGINYFWVKPVRFSGWRL